MSNWHNLSWPRRLWSASVYWDIQIVIGIICFDDVPVFPMMFVRRFKIWIGPPGKGRINVSTEPYP